MQSTAIQSDSLVIAASQKCTEAAVALRNDSVRHLAGASIAYSYRGMLLASTLGRPCLFTGCSTISGCGALFRNSYSSPASASPAMDNLRQRKHVPDVVVTRSRTRDVQTLNTQQGSDSPPQPALKRRRLLPAKPKSKGLSEHADDGGQTPQPSSSADTTFSAVPAIASGPSELPASIPANIPADPNVLHCWTKDSMAAAAKHLAHQDAGASAM